MDFFLICTSKIIFGFIAFFSNVQGGRLSILPTTKTGDLIINKHYRKGGSNNEKYNQRRSGKFLK